MPPTLTEHELEIDSDGVVTLVTRRALGHVYYCADEIPPELAEAYADAVKEQRDAEAYGKACQRAAVDAYRDALGDPWGWK